MKKLLSLLLALVLVFSLTACGADAGKKVDVDEKAATETVENFMDAVIAMDAEKVAEYLDDDSAISEEFKSANVEAIMETLPTEFDAYADDFETVMSDFISKVSDSIKYEIKDVEKEDDDEFVFTLEVTLPSEDADMDALLEDKLSDTAVNDLLMDLLSSGEISMDSTEEEIYDLLFPKLIDMIEEAFNELEIVTEEKEIEIVVTEDDEWLINTDKSDLSLI